MKKTIALLGLCSMLLTTSKLDAVFAVAVATDLDELPHQEAYQVVYGDSNNPRMLGQALAYAQKCLLHRAAKENRSCTISKHRGSSGSGDFTLGHGFFAIVQGSFAQENNGSILVRRIGVGVDAHSQNQALENAAADAQATNYEAFGIMKQDTLRILQQGTF